jgi:thymidylate synthase (FAD)
MIKIVETSATYLDRMGSDLTVANAARASFDKESGWMGWGFGEPYKGAIQQKHHHSTPGGVAAVLTQADAKLLRFLARGYRTDEWDALLDSLVGVGKGKTMEQILLQFRDKAQHWAPFAHPHIQLRLEMPVFLARQFVKHQVGGVWSEMSRRYVSDDLEFWFPRTWHTRPEDIKQGSGEAVANQAFCSSTAIRVTEQAAAAYSTLLAEGVTPEEARIVLPLNLMTTVVWTGSLLFWARVVNQRVDPHAQLAAQELGRKISAQIEPYYPVSWRELVTAL